MAATHFPPLFSGPELYIEIVTEDGLPASVTSP